MRDLDEAAVALRGGADVLDLKDPSRGSLGPCGSDTLRAVVALRDTSGTGIPVSVALGDAPDGRASVTLASRMAFTGADYVKIGLRGMRTAGEATAALAVIVRAARRGRGSTRVIAALFADDDRALSPPLADLPEIAREAGADGCLVDTLGKSGAGLLDLAAPGTLAALIADCRRRRLLSALAGSIAPAHLMQLRALGPDFIGARGALCAGGRNGPLDPARLSAFRAALHAS